MTAKTDKLPESESDISLDAIAWVRVVRDAMYVETSMLSADDFIPYVRRAAQATNANEEASGTRSGVRPA